jgi:anti-anti-sigma factor
MTASAQWVKSSNQLELVGHVDFNNAVSLLREGEAWIDQFAGKDCLVSFAGVTHSKSASIALIVGLRRHAGKAQKNITIAHVPDNLLSTIRLGGLDWLVDPATPVEQ